MKKQAFIFLILLFHHLAFGQDYRILQKDKGKLFISTTRSGDSMLEIAIINADWRLDYVQKNCAYYYNNKMKVEYGSPSEPLAYRSKHRMAHIATSAEEHHAREPLTHTFYVDISDTISVNGIFRLINEQYLTVVQMGDDNFKLIKNFLPDSAAEYYVDGYKGSNSAAVEIMYLWGAPLRGWSVGCAVSVHNREARKVLNSILCMGPDDTELEARKIKLRQSNLLAIMSYTDMFCQ
jgi:hypothetical protein